VWEGIHPFNCNAIPTQGGGSEIFDTEILLEKQGDDFPDNADQIENDSSIAATPTSAYALSSPPQIQQSKLSEDKVALFERSYKEEYKILVDEDYVTWWKLNHPDVLPVDKLSPTLNSVVDVFSYVSPLHSISRSRELVEPADGGFNSPETKVHAQSLTSVTTPKFAENLSSKYKLDERFFVVLP